MEYAFIILLLYPEALFNLIQFLIINPMILYRLLYFYLTFFEEKMDAYQNISVKLHLIPIVTHFSTFVGIL